jgi:L-ascorbate metabolism protein UlaG (beta-lactamase superfamily)
VVIATNETFFASKLSTSLAKSGQPVDLVHHDHIDHLGMQVLEQPLKRRAVQIAAGIGGIIVPRPGQPSDAWDFM